VLIDRVHGDGQRERVKLALDRLSRQDVAAYRPSLREMVLDPSKKQEELDIIHQPIAARIPLPSGTGRSTAPPFA
jgi:hypothetical protein